MPATSIVNDSQLVYHTRHRGILPCVTVRTTIRLRVRSFYANVLPAPLLPSNL